MRISWVLCALAACLAAGLFAATPGAAPVELRWGPPIFGGYLDLTASGMELTTVDLNGDGLRDAVTTNFIAGAYKEQPIAVLLNKGHGRLEVATKSIFEGQPTRVQWARKTVVADFNGDGRPDLFFADHGSVTDLPGDPRPGHHNELALSTPAGKLVDATATLPQHSDFTHSAAAADIDGNGTIDLFLGNFDCCGDGTPAEILLNDGTGHFRETTDRLPVYGGQRPPGHLPFTASEFVDVNRDGAPDLVLGGGDFEDHSILLLNDGHGFFRSIQELPPPVYGNSYGAVMDIKPVDLNADGNVDLLFGETQVNPYYVGSRIQVLINDGGGHFRDESATRMPQQPPVQSWPMRLLVNDFNGDGQLDFAIELAVPLRSSSDATPFYLNHNGVFEPFVGAKEAPVNPRGLVGFVNGAGPYAMISFANGGRHAYYLSPQLVALTAPTGVAATSVRTGVRIVWDAVANATGYEVWRNGTSLMKTTSTTAVDTTAQRGRSYRYAVRAVESSERGPLSAAIAGRRR